MNDNFVIQAKEIIADDKTVVMSIRMDRDLQTKYDELSSKTGRSRNELMCMALEYAISRVEIKPAKKEK